MGGQDHIARHWHQECLIGNSEKEKLLFAFKPIRSLSPPKIRTTVAFFGVHSVGEGPHLASGDRDGDW